MTTTIQRASSEVTITPGLRPLALAVLLSGVFLAMTDFFVVNVALADIGRDLSASTSALELVVAGYAVTYALFLVIGGRLGDAVGRRRMFLLGMAAFTATSALCGFAPTATTLVLARVAQGAASALMVPQVLATLQATTTGRGRARALAAFGATGGLAAVFGQLGGGLLVAADLAGTGWRPVFLVNVPIGLVAMVLAARVLPDTRSDRPARVDLPGTALLGATVLALLVPLVEGRSQGWPPWAFVSLALSPLLAWALFRVESRLERAGGAPLLAPSLVQLPGIRRGLGIAWPFFAGFGGFMFVYAELTQFVLGWTALRAGLALVPMGAAFLVGSISTAWLVARWGRTVITAGGVLQGLALVVLAVTVRSAGGALTPLDLAPGMLLVGAGQSMVMSPLIGVVLADVPAHAAGAAAGLFATFQQSSLALGVAVFGTIFLELLPRYGEGRAYLVGALVQTVAAVVVVVLSRRLPARARTSQMSPVAADA
ncbi:MFS transporter [Pengzhenrongella sp.]|jgi:MFS family permease|uniref:MFS transporter n=1 Tax=Pengzhenrongella sp. TaxID=2888820 RepID=UPI002F932A15